MHPMTNPLRSGLRSLAPFGVYESPVCRAQPGRSLGSRKTLVASPVPHPTFLDSRWSANPQRLVGLRPFSFTTPTAQLPNRKIKRFWKSAEIRETTDGIRVTLDGRPVKTPGGKQLVIPHDRRMVAVLLAGEWESVQILKQYSLVLTSLVARALDDFAQQEVRQQVVNDLCKFIHTDTICYRQPYPEPLIRLQQKYWDPLIAWLYQEYGIRMHSTEGILSVHQDEVTVEALRVVIQGLDPFELAAFERATLHTKSFVTGLALVKRAITAEEAAAAARVEVQYQIDMWGEVEDAHDVDSADMKRHLGAAVAILLRNS